jgi:hypothetical protein
VIELVTGNRLHRDLYVPGACHMAEERARKG